MRMKRTLPLILLSLLLVASCAREPRPEEGCEGLLLLSMDSKAGDPAYEGTFRVAMFNANHEFTGKTGSYCSESFGESIRNWLKPCKVNAAGEPLDATDAVVASLSDADHDGKWGLRWSGSQGASLVVVSPAVTVHQDGAYAYVDWTPDAPLYISDPPAANSTFAGNWLGGEYVYTSGGADGKIPDLVDRRASVAIRIKCGGLQEGDVQRVQMTNMVTSGRYYFEKTAATEDVQVGLSLNNAEGHRGFTLADDSNPAVLYDCGAGAPMHLVKAADDFWLSTGVDPDNRVFLPAFDYASVSLEDNLRPVITVLLGTDKDKPFVAKVILNQKLNPMNHYIFTLLLSNAHVDVQLSVSRWEDGGGDTATETEPVYIGSVSYESDWENGGDSGSEGWH